MERKIRVLTAKLGFDMHNRGMSVVNRALRDGGTEVVYIGNQFPEGIAETALQEDVDVIGISSLNSASSLELMERVMDMIKKKHLEDRLVIFGGIILPDDVPKLKEMGVNEYFPPGSNVDSIVSYIKENVPQ
ncbi:MAG: methylmalonyl-CoA mutase subunit beta [Candidatus Methanolliviera sp. GoM_asphalt]|nr:MAG: methylmalonyl-CoA mutase subunit beta [Candidatus Methanolliviera sp. GoM_asphalt]